MISDHEDALQVTTKRREWESLKESAQLVVMYMDDDGINSSGEFITRMRNIHPTTSLDTLLALWRWYG